MTNDQEEFKDYIEKGFEPIQTGDGSFTLKQQGFEEEMHSRGGAVSESMYIYYDALESFFQTCQNNDEVEVISVGLGMGYNEILAAHAMESLNLRSDINLSLKILSYEKEEVLKALFLKRIEEPEVYSLFWAPFVEQEVAPLRVKEVLKEALVLKSLFSEDAVEKLRTCKRIVLFDAYSNKTSEELWGESFLEKLFAKCGEGSVVTTYAATGALKRVLKKTGFKNLKRKGFAGKRESTLAVKV